MTSCPFAARAGAELPEGHPLPPGHPMIPGMMPGASAADGAARGGGGDGGDGSGSCGCSSTTASDARPAAKLLGAGPVLVRPRADPAAASAAGRWDDGVD